MADLAGWGFWYRKEAGGLGLGVPEMAAVAEGLGRARAPEPLVAVAGLTAGVLAAGDGQSLCRELLAGLISGHRIPALAWQEDSVGAAPGERLTRIEVTTSDGVLSGRKYLVAPAESDSYIVSAGSPEGLMLYRVGADAAGVAKTETAQIDGSRVAELRFDRVAVSDAAVVASPALRRAVYGRRGGHMSTDWNGMRDEAFRQAVRADLEANYPGELRYPSRRLRWHEVKDWYLRQAERGWTARGWRREYGGVGPSPAKQLIFIEEQENWGVARAPDHGVSMVGPLLIQYGTEEQKRRFLPRILSWENIWCQGYSEPNAGSDLVSLRTSAMVDGDDYVVNGQKTWTTLAQDTTHMFLLVRTDPRASMQQKGIGFLLVDLDTPGITVRPIRNSERNR